MATFDTIEKAQEAGYNVARERHLETYRGYYIEEVDVTGGGLSGSRFAVRARPCGAIAERGILGTWGSTIPAWIQNGCHQVAVAMFAPGELVRAIRQAEAAVRAEWLRVDPDHAMAQPTNHPGAIGGDSSDETGTDMEDALAAGRLRPGGRRR